MVIVISGVLWFCGCQLCGYYRLDVDKNIEFCMCVFINQSYGRFLQFCKLIVQPKKLISQLSLQPVEKWYGVLYVCLYLFIINQGFGRFFKFCKLVVKLKIDNVGSALSEEKCLKWCCHFVIHMGSLFICAEGNRIMLVVIKTTKPKCTTWKRIFFFLCFYDTSAIDGKFEIHFSFDLALT